MKCVEQAKTIYEICVNEATDSTLTYRKILDGLGYKSVVTGQAIRYWLELVLIACAYQNLPKLPSIIVNKVSGTPSAGEYTDNSWEKEAEKVFGHKNWPDVMDMEWDYVWKNRNELSKKYGTPGYWNNKKG